MGGRAEQPFSDPEEQRRYYETLIESNPTAVVTADPELIITSWNPAAERLFGYASDEAIGRHIDEFVSVRPRPVGRQVPDRNAPPELV